MEISVERGKEIVRLCGGKPARLVPRGHGWAYLFIQDSEGIQIGRMTFRDGTLCYHKCYKPDYYDCVDESDLIFMRLGRFLKDGVFIPVDVFWGMWERAQEMARESLVELQAWRDANPKIDSKTGGTGKRKSLKGRRPKGILCRLVEEHQGGKQCPTTNS